MARLKNTFKIQPYDKRCGPSLDNEWEDYTVMVEDQPYVPYDTVQKILAENQMLKDMMLREESAEFIRSYNTLNYYIGQSTTNIITRIKNIHLNTGIPSQQIYRFIYGLMSNYFYLDFKKCPKDKSKLQWLWSEGWLPQMSLIVMILEQLVPHVRSSFNKEYNEIRNKLINKYKQKGAKNSTPTVPF